MNTAGLLRLLVLGAIWGGSFAIQRVVVPVLGPATTASVRLLIGGGILLCFFQLTRGPKLEFRKHWRIYSIIGVVNSGVPFLLFAFSANHIPAAYSAVLNSLTPLLAMIISAVLLRQKTEPVQWLGAVIATMGVSLIVGLGPMKMTPITWVAVVACAIAAACYAAAGLYMKRHATHLNPYCIAAASQLAAAAFLVVPVAIAPPAQIPSSFVIGLALVLGVFCSGIAYLLYFRIVADTTPVFAMSVTFLIPVFGAVWARIFLREPLTETMLAGCAIVVAGTVLVLRKRPRLSNSPVR